MLKLLPDVYKPGVENLAKASAISSIFLLSGTQL